MAHKWEFINKWGLESAIRKYNLKSCIYNAENAENLMFMFRIDVDESSHRRQANTTQNQK